MGTSFKAGVALTRIRIPDRVRTGQAARIRIG